MERLSDREREVMELIAEGLSNKDIAAELLVSPQTIKTHVAHILTKLDAPNRAGATATWCQRPRAVASEAPEWRQPARGGGRRRLPPGEGNAT